MVKIAWLIAVLGLDPAFTGFDDYIQSWNANAHAVAGTLTETVGGGSMVARAKFVKNSYTITVSFWNNRACKLVFQRIDHHAITPAESAALLAAYAKNLAWKRDADGGWSADNADGREPGDVKDARMINDTDFVIENVMEASYSDKILANPDDKLKPIPPN